MSEGYPNFERQQYSNDFDKKYNKPEDEEPDLVDELDHDKEVDRVAEAYFQLKDRLLPETQVVLDDIVKKVKGSYDPDNEEWTEALAGVDELLAEFDDAADDEEREQSELNAEEQLRNLKQKIDGLVSNKKTGIH